jgi:hypothetical protein
MTGLTLFEALVVTHFIMDWIFQTSWEANQKAEKWWPLLVHCAVYTLGFIPAFLYFDLSPAWLAFIFATHAVFDRRKLEFWIMDKVKRFKKAESPEALYYIVLIGVDQTLHLATLAAVAVWK